MSNAEISHGAIAEAQIPQTSVTAEADNPASVQSSDLKEWMGKVDWLRDSLFEPKPVAPTIHYHWSLRRSQVPYKVEVDGERIAELMRATGLNDEQIKETTITVKRRPRILPSINYAGVRGSYSTLSNTIELYTDPIWKERRRHEKKAANELSKAQQGEVKDGPMSRTIFEKVRYPWLKHTSPHESSESIERTISDKANRKITNFLLRQVSRSIDANHPDTRGLVRAYSFTTGLMQFGAFVGGFVGGYKEFRDPGEGFLDFVGAVAAGDITGQVVSAVVSRAGRVISPLEYRGRKFANEHLDAYADIVKLTPKSPQSLIATK